MEEAKARKEAQKLKEKQYEEELERRVLADQKKLTQQEIEDIKKEGGKVPEQKQFKQKR